MKNIGLNWKLYIVPLYITILAVILGSLVWIIEAVEIKWATIALVIAMISIGFVVNILLTSVHLVNKINGLSVTLERIENLQNDIQKEYREQQNSSSTIVPTLQAFSQMYLDYLTKHKNEEQKQDNNGVTEEQ